jgi:hypothetical protein
VNKETLNVVEVLNSAEKSTVFTPIKDFVNIFGVRVRFQQIHRDIPPYQEVLCHADLVLVQNLSMDDEVSINRTIYTSKRRHFASNYYDRSYV